MNHSDFAELVRRTRSVRRFDGSKPVSLEVLRWLVDLARTTPSSRNLQPLKYILVNEPTVRDAVFDCLNWARALTDWSGPAAGQRPAAFIVILSDTRISEQVKTDHGITIQTMMLAARTRGLAGCPIASVDRDRLREALEIPLHYDILLIMALGVPAEEVVLEELPPNGDTKYWRNGEGAHHVPKRSLKEIIVREFTP